MYMEKTVNTAVILCGGLGTRFLPTTKVIPKEMLPVYNKPLLHRILDSLQSINIKKCYILISKNKKIIVDYYKRNKYLDKQFSDNDSFYDLTHSMNDKIEIKFIYQDKPQGTGHCVELLQKYIGDRPFLLIFGDNLLDDKNNTLKKLCANFVKYKKSVLLVQKINKSQLNRFSVIKPSKIQKDNILVDSIVEKPLAGSAPSLLAYMGVGILNCEIYYHLHKCTTHNNGEKYLTDALQSLARNQRLNAFVSKDKNYDFGDVDSYFMSNIEFMIDKNKNNKNLKRQLYKLINKK